ncbi:hypothetical protein Scep_010988 [Stephania cephalantha]|uniref:Uncharacterized protein n=1 Tax=Stephania cephalantha TaxID=152367 RepID=A0AAP0PES3_9MAGN
MESPTCSNSGSSPSSACRNSSIITQRSSMSSDCKHGKRTAAVFPEPEEELEIERWPDDESECMWLSSDGKSSSFKFNDYGSWDLFSIDLQDLFSTMKNHDLFRGKRISAFLNESMPYPIKGTSLILDKSLKDVLNEEPSSMSVAEVANLDEFDTNGPLFWPFEHKFGSASSESSWDFFVMSPLKSGRKAVNVEGFITPRKPLMLRLHESRKHKEWTTNTMPSRLGQSSQHSVKDMTTEFKDEYRLISEEIPIETLIGLEEFDGREGVDADLIEDCFSLDEFLEDNTNILSR